MADQKPQDFQTFQDELKLSLGDRQASIELEKPDPDYRIAYSGFLQGRNHPYDIAGMIWLYRNLRSVPDLEKAISIWKAADAQMDEMIALGEKYKRAVQGSGLDVRD